MLFLAVLTRLANDENNSAFVNVSCGLDASASTAACTETAGGSAANFPGTTTSTFGPDDYASALIPVTITAGSVTGGAAATTGASATAPTASATTKAAASAATTAASTGSAASTASGLSTVASSASSTDASTSAKATSAAVSTGGMPQITGNAQWAMGGVAVAVALAAL